MAASMPKHNEWKALKKKHKIPDKSVKGIHIGKVLDTYWANLATPKKNYDASIEVEKQMVAYIEKYAQGHKDKKYKPFIDDFMKSMLGECKKVQKEMKQMAGGIAVYYQTALELASATQQLKTKGTTKADLEKYKSGPLRKLGAVGSKTGGIDITKINAVCGEINRLIDKEFKEDTDPDMFSAFVDRLIKAAELIVKECKRQEMDKK